MVVVLEVSTRWIIPILPFDWTKRSETTRNDIDRVVLLLHPPCHNDQRLPTHHHSLLVVQVLVDNDVRKTTFIFEQHEGDPLCGLRSLTHHDQPG